MDGGLEASPYNANYRWNQGAHDSWGCMHRDKNTFGNGYFDGATSGGEWLSSHVNYENASDAYAGKLQLGISTILHIHDGIVDIMGPNGTITIKNSYLQGVAYTIANRGIW